MFPQQSLELPLVVRGRWRSVGFLSRPDGGTLWWFCDGLPDPGYDEREIAAIDTRVASEIARRQSRWRERAEANRRRKLFGADRPIGRVLP
jgi:hypothetical protein